MKTILVTGSKGFIATNLLLELNSLHGNDLKLVGIDNDSADSNNEVFTSDFCHHNNVDLRSRDELKSFFSASTYKFDFVIHLAAAGNVVNSVVSPLDNFDSNVNVTINLLRT